MGTGPAAVDVGRLPCVLPGAAAAEDAAITCLRRTQRVRRGAAGCSRPHLPSAGAVRPLPPAPLYGMFCLCLPILAAWPSYIIMNTTPAARFTCAAAAAHGAASAGTRLRRASTSGISVHLASSAARAARCKHRGSQSRGSLISAFAAKTSPQLPWRTLANVRRNVILHAALLPTPATGRRR